MDEIPTDLFKTPTPLFPLPNCVLLPGAVLPLRIFEPRYRQMIVEVLRHEDDSRLIAIALLKDGFEPLYETNHASIHPVVCVGRILHHEKLDDGLFNILLLGCCRAEVESEDVSGAYRLANLAPLTSEGELDEDAVAGEISALLAQAVAAQVCTQELVQMLVEAAPDLATFIDLVAFHFMPGSECDTKQQVLANRDVAQRSALVTRWLRTLLARRRERHNRAHDGRHRNLN
jgi:Lon protease-like protein